MTFSNEKTSQQVNDLLEALKQYIQLQKQAAGLKSTEVAVKLFSTLIVVTALLIVGFIFLFFAGMALALWLGNLMGTDIGGFAAVAVLYVLLALVIYLNRTAWIVTPVTRYTLHVLAPEAQSTTLDDVATEQDRLKTEIEVHEQQLHEQIHSIITPDENPVDKFEQAVNTFRKGYNLFHGVQLGLATVKALRKVFAKKKD